MPATMLRTRPAAAAPAVRPDVSTPAVVLKFDRNVMHHGSLGAIRSLGRMGVCVYAVQESAWSPAAQSRYLHQQVLWRPDQLPADRVLSGLHRLAALIGRPAVLIPTDDAAAIFLAEHGGELSENFLMARPPAALPRQLAGKHSLHQLCAELGVPSPRCQVPASLAEAEALAADFGYPLMAKLARPWQSGPGQLSTQIVGDRAALAAAWHQAGASPAGLMLQQFIPAAPGSDWFFHGYVSRAGVCLAGGTGVKERSYPAQAGLTSFGRWVPNERLGEQAAGLLEGLRYRGIADLDLRLDDRDGQYKLLDANPRLGAQFRLFTAAGGLDVVRAAYLDLTGQPVPAEDAVSGRSFMAESYDPLTAISYWRRGQLGVADWLAAARATDEAAWFARDDLRPFQLMCVRMGWRLLSRPVARRLSRPDTSGRPAAGLRLRRGRRSAARQRNRRAGQLDMRGDSS